MKSYLLDTNIISAGAPLRNPSPSVVDWMDQNSGRLFLSTVTIAEIEIGIAKARQKRATRKAILIGRWLEEVLNLYLGRIFLFDLKAARIAGALAQLSRSNGNEPDFADLAIASIAKSRGLTLLTNNTKHFAPFEIAYHDPFRSLPS